MRALYAIVPCSWVLVLSGCLVMPIATPSTNGSLAGAAMQGRVYGGQQPIVGAHVYFYAANTTGYGSASVSLLKSVSGTTLDGSGNYYVTTDANGNFSITGDYTCPSSASQVYLYSIGGNSGSGTNNPSAGLMAAVGTCPAGGTLSPSLFINVNEVSTVATAYAIAGFATDATHVSSSGTALAKTGIANAFANVANLETLSTGTALATTPSGLGTAPQSAINTGANILSACVNSTGAVTGPANPTPCYTLFTNTLSGGTTGTQPTETATAEINIAHNPTANIAAIFSLASANPPFQPAVSTPGSDLTMEIYSGAGHLGAPIAIDGQGNIWIADGQGFSGSSVIEIGPVGTSLPSGTAGYIGVDPVSIAIDTSASPNIWIGNSNQSGVFFTVSELSSSGTPSAFSPISGGGLSYPGAAAIDGSGNIWFASADGPSTQKISSSGSFLSGTGGYTGVTASGVQGMAIDGSGNVWLNGGPQVISNSGAQLNQIFGAWNSPAGVAVDSGGNAWIVDSANNNLHKITNGLTQTVYTGGGLSRPQGVAIDGGGNVWVANRNGNSVSEFSNSGTPISPAAGFAVNYFLSPAGIAIDGSGNVWVTNLSNGSVTQVVGAAVPVITPIAAGLPATPTLNGTSSLGTRP